MLNHGLHHEQPSLSFRKLNELSLERITPKEKAIDVLKLLMNLKCCIKKNSAKNNLKIKIKKPNDYEYFKPVKSLIVNAKIVKF